MARGLNGMPKGDEPILTDLAVAVYAGVHQMTWLDAATALSARPEAQQKYQRAGRGVLDYLRGRMQEPFDLNELFKEGVS